MCQLCRFNALQRLYEILGESGSLVVQFCSEKCAKAATVWLEQQLKEEWIMSRAIRQIKPCAALIRTNKTGFRLCGNDAEHNRRYCKKHLPENVEYVVLVDESAEATSAEFEELKSWRF